MGNSGPVVLLWLCEAARTGKIRGWESEHFRFHVASFVLRSSGTRWRQSLFIFQQSRLRTSPSRIFRSGIRRSLQRQRQNRLLPTRKRQRHQNWSPPKRQHPQLRSASCQQHLRPLYPRRSIINPFNHRKVRAFCFWFAHSRTAHSTSIFVHNVCDVL